MDSTSFSLHDRSLKHVSWKVIIVWLFRWAAFLFLLVASVAFLESFIPSLARLSLSDYLIKAAAAILGALFLYDVVRYNGIRYSLTDRGVHYEYGILTKKQFIAPYEGIQDIDVETSLLERILGIGTVVIETAGVSAKKIEESFAIPGVESPRRFARMVIEKAAEARKPLSVEKFKEDMEALASEISEVKEGLEGMGNALEFYEEKIKSMEGIISSLEEKVITLAEEKRNLMKKLEKLQEEQKKKEMMMEEIKKAVQESKPKKKASRSTAKKTTAKKAVSSKKSSAKRSSKKSTTKKKQARSKTKK